ncbi:MAG TPA: thiamine phosphate synthase [Bryobacteraceae bacterium]|nr:thiamine phosphate synthase [Bryobacteraceae bacterium]
MIRCLITDGTFAVSGTANRARWMAHLEHWIAEGIALVQIRERDLPIRDLAELTKAVLKIPNPLGTKILVNDRIDVALACGAHGVHLRDGSISPTRFARQGFIVTVSCHRPEGADDTHGASFVLLAPIFKPLSKTDRRLALGTRAITDFCRRSPIPVLALGGISRENARDCIDAGAAGIAGITCFGGSIHYPL